MKKWLSLIITSVGSMIIGIGVGSKETSKALKKEINEKQDFSEKHLELFLLMNQWVKLKQEGKHLQDYFEKRGYRSIAIYGISYVGERLFEELKESDIDVKYGIDKKADGIYLELEIVTMNDDFEKVDAIVVTPIHYFEEIEEVLSNKIDCPIISIEDIVYEL